MCVVDHLDVCGWSDESVRRTISICMKSVCVFDDLNVETCGQFTGPFMETLHGCVTTHPRQHDLRSNAILGAVAMASELLDARESSKMHQVYAKVLLDQHVATTEEEKEVLEQQISLVDAALERSSEGLLRLIHRKTASSECLLARFHG